MKKVYLLLLSLVVLMIALTGCGKDTDSAKDNSKPITLRYSTMQNKDHISYQVALNIKQAVEEKTEGRVLIDIYPANQLGDWSQVYDELMMGSIDMAHSSVPETYDARTAVGYFPYLSSSYDQLAEIFAEGTTLDNMMKEIQAKNGIEFCGFFVEGIAGIGTTKEVSNPNTLDSKNTVIRTAAMDCYILPCEYMGFDTTSIASSDTFAALQTGVVEGLAGSTPAGAYLNYRDIIDYYYSDYLQYRDINWNPLVLFEKNLLMPVLHFHGKHLERLEQMMYMLVAESENKQNFQDVFIADISELIVLEIGRYCGSIYPEIVRNAVYNDVFKDIPYMLKNILEYINSNYQNSSLTLSSIAERFWVNPSYLSRYFKTYMGINIVQYIRSMRIFYAKSLLQSSDMSIAEVAEKVGVKSASHFSKIFENEVGESPSKFRKSCFDRNHS